MNGWLAVPVPMDGCFGERLPVPTLTLRDSGWLPEAAGLMYRHSRSRESMVKQHLIKLATYTSRLKSRLAPANMSFLSKCPRPAHREKHTYN